MTETAPSMQLLRRVNAGALLAIMRKSGGVMTASELVKATGLTRATVISICDDLVEMGWVKELENQRDAQYAKGRPARRFAFDARAGYVLGVDLGDAKTRVMLADLSGEPLAKVTLPFSGAGAPAAERLDVVNRAVLAALEDAEVPSASVLAVSVGVAAPVSRDEAVLVTDAHWQMFDIDLPKALADQYGWHVLLENDANLAALGERWRGAAQGVDDVAVLLAGDRIGAGVFESGRLLHGSRGGFGELGYVGMIEGVEGPLGLATLARTWGREAVLSAAPTSLSEMCPNSPDDLTAEMVFAAAAGGDHVAAEILNRLATSMARVIASLSCLLNPALVVIGGAVADSAHAIIPDLTDRLSTYTSTPPLVAASQLGEAIVSIGAVRHALDYVEDHALEMRPADLKHEVA
ncbi:ROK family transcriptional regulator [Streptomyces sioyaensis]|uniref:ROK family transcriptional regulator n=1 Tax=Streptomyces sioyaensis TaxID=67364 RepID=UPI0033CCEC89